jgi:hypothetical protein
MNALVLAVALSLLSAACYAAAAVAQERIAVREAHASWPLAIGLTGLGAGLHVVALPYGPLTLLQPLGALSLVLAVPMGAAAHGRHVTHAEWRGAALTLLGLTGLLLTTSSSAPHALGLPATLGLAGVTAAAVAALIAIPAGSRVSVAAGLRYGAAAGIAFGVGSAMTQTALDRFTGSGWSALLTPEMLVPAILVAPLSLGGLLLSQAAYRGGLGAPLATATLVNPAAAAVIGLLLAGDRFRGGAAGPAIALLAAGVAAHGVVLLTLPSLPATVPGARLDQSHADAAHRLPSARRHRDRQAAARPRAAHAALPGRHQRSGAPAHAELPGGEAAVDRAVRLLVGDQAAEPEAESHGQSGGGAALRPHPVGS